MPARERLSNRRPCESISFTHGGMKYTASIARYSDGRLAEIFISGGKSGSDADAAAKDTAVICSIALQHSVPVQTIRHALLRDARGNPASVLGAALDLLLAEQKS
jgi:ribonucleoside-diphosphate reductase alpha chain